jgi:sugar (pentulose or hexulose) kinase
MVGAVGAGLYPDLPAASLMIRVGRRYFPDPASTAIYEGSYTRYRALYPALRSVFDGTTDN